LTGNITGLLSGDNITVTYATEATLTSAPGIYAITPQVSDPNNVLDVYKLVLHNGTLTILPPGSVTMTSLIRINNRSHISGTGDPNVAYTIQASSDLKNWTTIGTASSDESGQFEFDESDNSNSGSRFFRAFLP